jgi:hypothetical protein
MAEAPAPKPRGTGPHYLKSRVIAWFAALAALLFLVRDQLGPVLTLVAGMLIFAGGVGFVIAPLIRRHAGTANERDRHLLHSRSFLIGLGVTLIGLAISGYGIYRIVQHAVDKANKAALTALPHAGAPRTRA